MAGLITVGVAKIEVGAIAVDGGMGTTLAPLGYTEEGSAAINMDDPTETEFNVEELETPLHIQSKAGKIAIAFKVANPDEDTLVSVFGGSKTGTGSTAVYKWPVTPVIIERSIKITPAQGMGINVPRAKITAKFSSEIGRAALLGIEVTGTVLQPTKANEPALSTFRVV